MAQHNNNHNQEVISSQSKDSSVENLLETSHSQGKDVDSAITSQNSENNKLTNNLASNPEGSLSSILSNSNSNTNTSNNNKIDLSAYTPHDVSSVLKRFLQQLPEPLFTFDLYEDFMRISRKYNRDHDDMNALQETCDLIKLLPEAHKATLEILLKHLHQVSLQAEDNKMTPSNLGVVFGPTLFRQRRNNAKTGTKTKGKSTFANFKVQSDDDTIDNTSNKAERTSSTKNTVLSYFTGGSSKDKNNNNNNNNPDNNDDGQDDSRKNNDDGDDDNYASSFKNKQNNRALSILSAASVLDEIKDMPDQARLIELLIINRDYISCCGLNIEGAQGNLTAVLTRV